MTGVVGLLIDWFEQWFSYYTFLPANAGGGAWDNAKKSQYWKKEIWVARWQKYTSNNCCEGDTVGDPFKTHLVQFEYPDDKA